LIKNRVFILLFLITLISRLPFLGYGFGVEEDSWGTAVSAYKMSSSGNYETSRLPGHPVQDYIYSFMWGSGSWWFNFMTALMSALTTLFFALALDKMGAKHFFIAALAFAFCPVVYISSCYTIDYMWAMAFAMAAFYFLVSRQLVACGIILALAVGCRITTGALLIPFICYVYNPHQTIFSNFGRFLRIGVPHTIVSALLFIPVVKTYGWHFLVYYDQFPPSLAKLIYKGSLGVFGTVGFTGMLITIVLAIAWRKRIRKFELFQKPLGFFPVVAMGLAVLLFVVNYLQLPQKSAYLITAIPFLLILCSFFMNRKLFYALCICFITSSFICSINLTDKFRGAAHSKAAATFVASGQEIFFDPFSGPVFSDYSKRKVKLQFTSEVIRRTLALTQKTVIISGWFYNQLIIEQLSKPKNEQVEYIDYVDTQHMKDYLQKGYSILYLPEQENNNDVMFGVEHTTDYAKPMFVQ
jgi:hypothetical protein